MSLSVFPLLLNFPELNYPTDSASSVFVTAIQSHVVHLLYVASLMHQLSCSKIKSKNKTDKLLNVVQLSIE